MKYSINIKYWHDSHDHETFFGNEADAKKIYRTLARSAVNSENNVEFIGLWDDENNELLNLFHA